MVRAPVLATFSTTVLAQLASVFLIKEAVERLFEVGHHHGTSLPENNHFYFYGAAFASTAALLSATYSVANQPFNYVLRAAQSSVIQEHAADISHAICYVVPGLSRILLPRINSLSLLALCSATSCILTHWFITEFWWFDSIAVLVLSFTVFSTMMPLSTYTGAILLQTTPPHVHNQIDRCISEASTVEGVLELRNTHFWQVDFNSIAGTVDVRVRRDANEQFVLCLVSEKLSTVVGNLTVSIVKDVMNAWSAGGEHAPISSYQQWSHSAENHVSHAPAHHDHPHHDHHDDHHDEGGHGHSHNHSHLNGHGHSHH